jgi:hypothetical protein
MNYLYIFILCFVIITVSFYTQYNYDLLNIESFLNINNNNNNSIVLLGDSILKNNSYVKNGLSIEDILRDKKGDNLHCLALNHSTVVDVYSQIDNIPLELNNENTIIFLSSGGNDILSQYVDKRDSDVSDSQVLNVIFIAYKKMVKSLQTKMNKSKIVLIDIYYPTSNQFSQYKPIIKEWNNMLEKYSREKSFGLIQISKSVTASDDFTLSIEPSEKGGEKIARSILNYN